MGKVYSHIAWRVSRNLNVENRAQKVLSQEKIRPPPKYKSDKEFLKKVREEHPELSEDLEKKDDALLKRLQNVYVTSKDPVVPDGTGPDSRAANLPVDRSPPELPLFGYSEPERVAYGRATLRTVIGFLAAHSQDPAAHTAETIARRHKLDARVTEDILKHFRMMEMHAPDTDTGQIAQIEWTSQDPLSEIAFKDLDDKPRLPPFAPKHAKPPAEPTDGRP